ncbi:MAG: hypothetical protein HPY53_07965 [Brevinematales bacterium]|nr:hypothetical protein [Brevinematales bacterium]
MKKSSSIWITVIVIAVAVILPLFLFYNSIFLGAAIQGGDGNFASRSVYLHAIQNGITGNWMSANWLGINLGEFPTALWIGFLALFPLNVSIALAYAASISLALIFSYLLLKKLGAEWYGAIFGAVAYSFTPHFIALVFGGHISVVSMVPYPAMIFYFLTLAFDKANKSILKTVVSLIMTGISGAMMIINDPQRGMYFFVLIAIYTVFLIFRKSPGSPEEKIDAKKALLAIGKIAMIGIVFLLAYAHSLKGLISTFKFRGISTGEAVNEPKQSEDEKWKFITAWSMDPREVLDNLAFGYHGAISGDKEMPYWGTKPYCGNSESVGYFVIVFGILGIIFGFRRKDFTTKFFFWGGIAALLLSFGQFPPGSPFFWIWSRLPMMDKLRAPAKFIGVFAFAFSILAAFGFQWVLQAIRKYPKPDKPQDAKKIALSPEQQEFNIVMYFLVGLLALGFLWMIGLMMSGTGIIASLGKVQYDNMNGALLRMNVYSVLTLAVFYLVWSIRKDNLVKQVKVIYFIPFIVLLFYELWSINLFFINKAYFNPQEFFVKDGVTDYFTKDADKFRVGISMYIPTPTQVGAIPVTAVGSEYMNHNFKYYGIDTLDTTAMSRVEPEYDAFFRAMLNTVNGSMVQSLDDLINLNVRLFQIANVKYLITDGRIYTGQQPQIFVYSLTNNTNFAYIQSLPGIYNTTQYLFAVKNPLPRVGLFPAFVAVTNNADALKYLANPAFDFHKAAVVLGNMPDNSTNVADVIPQKVVEYEPWYLKINVISNQQGGILLNVTRFDPEWKVYVDGKPAELLKVNYIMQGVKLEPGDCTVEFRFEPASSLLKVSLGVIGGGVLLSAIYGIIYLIGYLRRKDEEV